jgi:hypothetical protein
MQNAQHFSQTLTESVLSQQIFIDVPNIKFHGHKPSRSEADTI